MVWIKALHIVAIAFWAGGLIALPALLRRDVEMADRADVVRLHHFTRFGYDALVSPAAVLAIASGMALVFSGVHLGDWLVLKLAAVAGMGVTHMAIGRVLDQLEAPEAKPTEWKRDVLTAAALGFTAATLFLVLARPEIDRARFPGWMLSPQGEDLPLIEDGEAALFPSSSSSSSSGGRATPT